MKKLSLIAVIMLGLVLLLAACGGGDEGEDTSGEEAAGNESEGGSGETAEWLFVTEETEGQVQMVYANEFKKRIEEATDGAVEVTVYEFGGLGDEKDQVQQLQDGAVQLAVTSPGFIGNTIKESQLFGLHFLFPASVDETQKILNESEAINTDLVKQYKAIGLLPLAFWSEGGMQWTGNKALNTPEAFENFKMRIQGTELQAESYQAYGADPQAMSWGDLYNGLESGVVDGQENPLFFIEDTSFYEVQDVLTLSNHNNYVATTTVNQAWFEGLSEERKTLVQDTVDDMQSWILEEQKKQNEESLQIMKDADIEVVELTEEERAAFKELAMPVRDFYRENVSTVDGAILDKLEQEIAEITGESAE